MIEACLRPGVSVARVALKHGINANLLRTWITRPLALDRLAHHRQIVETVNDSY
jgi:transposase